MPSPAPRAIDLESLKALAHPLRVQIVEVLSTYGPFTASGLADRLGESSGSTSYHLRQLEKHHFVREVEGKGTARERWWERVPGAISLDRSFVPDSEAARAASNLVLREWTNSRERTLRDFVERGEDLLTEEWLAASDISLANLTLTLEQLTEVTRLLDEFLTVTLEPYRGQRIEGARPVQVQVAAFPVADGHPLTAKDAS